MDFGDRLRKRLTEKNMSVTQLAEAAGVNRNTLYSYLRRNTRKPDPAVLERIAPVLGTTAAALLGMKEAASPQKLVQVRPHSGAGGYKTQRNRKPLGAEKASGEGEELWGIREALRRSPEMRTLFSLSRKATPEQLRQTIKIIEALRGDESEF